jgi:hypothetical protein
MAETSKDFEIRHEVDYQRTLSILARGQRAKPVLKFLMGCLESYRAKRKMGWSRPWNKYGVMNFQSFQVHVDQDSDLLDLACRVMADECQSMPETASVFAHELLGDRARLMGFIFIQEYTENGRRFEGANVSLGSRPPGKSRYRNRLDMILESPIINDTSQGFSRIRVYVDPYRAQEGPLWLGTFEPVCGIAAADLFNRLAAASWTWAHDATRLWDHWTSAYIDYFGPRQWTLSKSYFYVPNAPDTRLVP